MNHPNIFSLTTRALIRCVLSLNLISNRKYYFIESTNANGNRQRYIIIIIFECLVVGDKSIIIKWHVAYTPYITLKVTTQYMRLNGENKTITINNKNSKRGDFSAFLWHHYFFCVILIIITFLQVILILISFSSVFAS